MGVLSRVMNFFGLQDEEEVVVHEHVEHDPPETTTQEQFFAQEPRKTKGNVVSIHSQKTVKVMLSEPRSYDEAQEIADHLGAHRSVVVNLQRMRADQAIKIVDFLSGTIYALSGSIVKVGPNIFLCTPENVELQGTITDMLTSDGEE